MSSLSLLQRFVRYTEAMEEILTILVHRKVILHINITPEGGPTVASCILCPSQGQGKLTRPAQHEQRENKMKRWGQSEEMGRVCETIDERLVRYFIIPGQ